MTIFKKISYVITFFFITSSFSLANSEKKQEVNTLPLNEIRIFTEIFSKIKSDYVENIEDSTLLKNAIRGMLQGLDPHSAYLDKDSYKELQEGTSGEFGGLGIEVGYEDGFVKVISPIDDTPAKRAGIKAGDLIIRLDGKSVKGISLMEAVKMMRGKPGSEIELTILRGGEEKPFNVTIVRDIITVKNIKAETIESAFGYIRISNFQIHTVDDLSKALTKLESENNNMLKGLVLDLRNNPGGLLNAAVGVSDLFLDEGLIVYTEGRVKGSKLKFNAKPSEMFKDIPIIVLVNGGSASASEIVAGALQDHRRAIIMGERTFGKGSVQTILPMNDETALKLTTARYYTPSGRSIQASGIEPDMIVKNIKFDVKQNNNMGNGLIKESDLTGHLDSEVTKNDSNQKKDNVDNSSLAETDYQLYEALNVLKGLSIHLKKAG
ncbi:MAG: peptidase S41 [Legionellales bacterium]|jgi:carboxyl-terminal processing protease|nr:peptidase S41 [Legionellales bacterium]HBH10752.1 peptidase S41 [Gammaproteobacteria bacterium]|tara:strand:+ start:724 stop:2031 length:1308 start_codon:yes stop_codon:yes gene_type:complete